MLFKISSAWIRAQCLRCIEARWWYLTLILHICALAVLAGIPGMVPVTAQLLSPAAAIVAETSDTDTVDTSELLELNALSQSLIERARGGRADATRFRIDATLYRESLRRLMLGSRDSVTTHTGDDALYTQMVRMAALLHAAAECKTGRYITCPVELMRQLTAQQKLLDKNFEAHFGSPS